MREGLPKKEVAESISPFSHGEEFLDQAKEFFNKKGVEPEWGEIYNLNSESEGYKAFLKFFIEELDSLPFNDEVGETHLRRPDARDVVDRLKEYLLKKLNEVQGGQEWSNKDIGEIEDMFRDHLEVFKNEIYTSHGVDGVGYSLDLHVLNKDGVEIPSGVVLERRYISQKDGDIEVLDNGFFNLDLQSGHLRMDLEEFPSSGVHRD